MALSEAFFDKISVALQESKLPVTCRWLSHSSQVPADFSKRVLFTYWRQCSGDRRVAVKPTFCVSGFVDSSLVVSLVELDQLKEFQMRLDSTLSIHVYSLQPTDSGADSCLSDSCAGLVAKETLALYPQLSEIALGDGTLEKVEKIKSEDQSKNKLPEAKQLASSDKSLLTASETTTSVEKGPLSEKVSQVDKKKSQSEKKGSQFEKKGSQFEKKGSQFEKKGSQFEKKGSQFEKKGSQSEKKLSQSEESTALVNIKSKSHSDVSPVHTAPSAPSTASISHVHSSEPVFPKPPVLHSATQPPPPQATSIPAATNCLDPSNDARQPTRKRPCFDSDSSDSAGEVQTKEEPVAATKPTTRQVKKRVKRLKTRMYTTTDGEMVTEKYYASDSTEASDGEEERQSMPSPKPVPKPTQVTQAKKKAASKQKSIVSFFKKQ